MDSADAMETFRSVAYGVGNQSAIEGRQLATVCDSKSQKIAVCDLSYGQDTRDVEPLGVQQADVVWPEGVARECSQFLDHLGHDGWQTGGVWVTRVTDDAQYTILGEGAGGP